MAKNLHIGRRYYVHGRVQGVGFRYFVQNEAQQFSLEGYAKNRADGSVEVYASGPAGRLEKLKQRLWEGPGLSRVDNVEEQEAEAGQRNGFRVEH
jgi:acylphosphatase